MLRQQSGTLMAVADGVGGSQAGEVASRLATQTLSDQLSRASQGERPEVLMRTAFVAAHQAVRDTRRLPDTPGPDMGTTLTCAWIMQGEVVVGHAGDSRLYLLRQGEIRQLTDDHSVTGELARQGQITQVEAQHHPQRHMLTNALGERSFWVDVRTWPLQAGDLLCLCTDGLIDALQTPEVARIILDAGVEEGPSRLIAAALDAGAQDDVTVLVAAVDQDDVGVRA
jgi:protein phosphatase